MDARQRRGGQALRMAVEPGRLRLPRERAAELLLPPVGLALIHLRLQLFDVLGEVALLFAELDFGLRDELLALLSSLPFRRDSGPPWSQRRDFLAGARTRFREALVISGDRVRPRLQVGLDRAEAFLIAP